MGEDREIIAVKTPFALKVLMFFDQLSDQTLLLRLQPQN
jgi:hypothetical protein